MKEKKIIVAHFGKQHSYRLIEALNNNDNLSCCYLTTVYLKKYNWTWLTSKFLKGDNLKRVKSRECRAIKPCQVKQYCELGGIINLLLMRIDHSQKIYLVWSRYTAKRFAKKVARYTIKNNPDAIIMYDTNAKYCFEILEKKAPHIKRILDTSIATPAYMKKIFEEDMKRTPEFAQALLDSSRYFWDEKTLKRYSEEIQLTNYFLAPSMFVKESIEYHNITSDKILLCPYGVDTNKFNYKMKESSTEQLKCIYVGALTQRKGISYLLKAFEKFNNEEVSLTLVGAYDNSKGLFSKYLEKYDFKGLVTHNTIAELFLEADLMVFPSLSEGLSLAVLEALGSGIPVICTENSGYKGIVRDGYNGFIVPIGNSESIQEKIEWCLNNREKLKQMSSNARETALQYTWDNYNYRINQIIKEIL